VRRRSPAIGDALPADSAPAEARGAGAARAFATGDPAAGQADAAARAEEVPLALALVLRYQATEVSALLPPHSLAPVTLSTGRPQIFFGGPSPLCDRGNMIDLQFHTLLGRVSAAENTPVVVTLQNDVPEPRRELLPLLVGVNPTFMSRGATIPPISSRALQLGVRFSLFREQTPSTGAGARDAGARSFRPIMSDCTVPDCGGTLESPQRRDKLWARWTSPAVTDTGFRLPSS
jgi:hypothetical protein